MTALVSFASTPRPVRAALFVLVLAAGAATAGAADVPPGGHAGRRAAGPPGRPNIVVVMVDDMGFSDLGAYGSEIPTPNLDRLAREGTRFSQFYVTPRCAPTRASLLTGLYPHQAGLGHMPGDWAAPVRDVFGPPAYQAHLRTGRVATLAELLGRAGYRTLMTGKWHLGYERGHWPTDRGFDRFYGTLGGGVYFWPPVLDRRVVSGEEVVTPDTTNWDAGAGWHSTTAFAAHAVDFLEEAQAGDQPFFLYVAPIAPHFPLQAFPEAIAARERTYRAGWDRLRQQRRERLAADSLVRVASLPGSEEVPSWNVVVEKAEWTRKMAVYAAQVEHMDRSVGRLLDAIDRLGVRENTLVVFLSDNGADNVDLDRSAPEAPIGSPGSFASYGQPWASLSNVPFRGYKKQTYEGGIASPLIVRWPGVVSPGRVIRTPSHVIDLVPTLLGAAGAPYPDELDGRRLLPLEGESLLPVLRGRSGAVPERTLFWEHEGNRAVRHGRWKLVASYDQPWQLYDLEIDRGEANDLAGEQPRRVRTMARHYRQWTDRVGVGDWERVDDASE